MKQQIDEATDVLQREQLKIQAEQQQIFQAQAWVDQLHNQVLSEAEAIKNELKNGNEGHVEGALYKACVTLSERKTVDNKAVFKEANVPAELIAKYTRTTAVISVKVTSR